MKRFITGLLSISALAVSTLAFAQTKEVTIGYQDMVVPYRVAQEAKELEKATGYKINWKQFGGGGEVIKAMASGAAGCSGVIIGTMCRVLPNVKDEPRARRARRVRQDDFRSNVSFRSEGR